MPAKNATTTTVQTIPSRTYQPGTQTITQNVGNGVLGYVISFSRDQWLDPAVSLTIRFELSLDNGATWSPDPSGQTVWPWGMFPVTMTAVGGALVGPGGPIAATVQQLDLPDVTNNQRDIRAICTIAGGPLTTAITIQTIS